MSDAGFQSHEIILLAVSLGAALIYGLTWLRRPPSMARTVFKTVPVAALALLAWASGAPWLLVAALGFSALGDAALSRDGEAAFMAGLGSFLIAHIAYVPLFWQTGVGALEGWRLIAAPLCLVYAVIVARWLWPHLGEMRAPVAVYMLAIVAMGIAALTVPMALWPILLGALSFIASDTVLAAETFVYQNQPRRWTAPVVWITYYAAQALIASAFVCAAFTT